MHALNMACTAAARSICPDTSAPAMRSSSPATSSESFSCFSMRTLFASGLSCAIAAISSPASRSCELV